MSKQLQLSPFLTPIGCPTVKKATSLSFRANDAIQESSPTASPNVLRKRKSNSLSIAPTKTANPTPTARIYAQKIRYDICEGGRKKSETEVTQGPKLSGAIRPGMAMLKSFLTLEQQVSIVRECRRLGVGAGGFYRPKRECRWLMCLGLDWDPYTNSYDEIRRIDNVRPPVIPDEYLAIITSSIHAARADMEGKYPGENAEKLVPMISPDTALVNFYPASGGKLGLHRDRTESRESLAKGIPIVSMTIGDAGVFVYGEDYNEMMQGRGKERVIMESGDVLIFGGPSRHIMHGFDYVYPNSAPDSLVKETGLRHGRLNLTFRQY